MNYTKQDGRGLTVYDFAVQHNLLGEEITCVDSTYDCEFYCYPLEASEVDPDPNEFEHICDDLYKHLPIKEIVYVDNIDSKVFVLEIDLVQLIEDHIARLDEENLFIHCDTDHIVPQFELYVAGYTSEKWFRKFVNILCE